MESLLKHRKALVMDRLPSFLQHYRNLLKLLCAESNSDVSNENTDFKALADCAHRLEKLTKSLVTNSKDMGRISMYLIADVLQQYEQITLHPNVKVNRLYIYIQYFLYILLISNKSKLIIHFTFNNFWVYNSPSERKFLPRQECKKSI